MSWVVVVHADPAALVAELERAGLVVEQVGVVGAADGRPDAPSWRPGADAPARPVLVVSNPGVREKAA